MNSQYIKFFRESLIALGITIFGELITGSLWGSFYSKFLVIAGIIALIPVIGENRGNISGIFTSRLGTGLHLGSIKPSLRKRTKELNNTILMNLVLTLTIPVWTSLIVFTFNHFTGGPTSYFQFLFVAIGAALILVTIQPILTLGISFIVYEKGLDPDVVVYPIISVIADVMTSIAIFIVVSIEIIAFPSPVTSNIEKMVEIIALTIFSLFLAISFIRPIQRRSNLEFELFDLLRESLPIILFSIIIGSVVGLILDNAVSDQSVVLILPIFMSYTGAVGSVIGSKFTTNYHLGSLSTRSGKIDMYLLSPSILIGVCIFLSSVLGMVAFTIATFFKFSMPSSVTMVTFVITCCLIGIVTTTLSIVIALILGNLTFRRGLDADNVIVPLSTTLGDLIAIISVVSLTNLFFF